MIDFCSISVIVQGLYDPEITPRCLKSIKNHLPEAEIILSLSKPQPAEVIAESVDKLLTNEETPVFFYASIKDSKLNAVNPQIVSTIAGLKAATRPYALKIRTDFVLKSANFLKYFDDCPHSDPEFKIFDHKIIDCSYFARHPERYAYHPSDIALFGKTSDLLNLFDVPLMKENEFRYWEKDNVQYCRYVPEQHIFINCLRKNGKKINLDCWNDEKITHEDIIKTGKYFASNFIFLGYNRFGLIPPNKFYDFQKNEYNTCITYVEGLRLYQKYVDADFKINENDVERKFINKIRVKSFYKIVARVISLFFIGKKNKVIRRKIRSLVPALLYKIILKRRL